MPSWSQKIEMRTFPQNFCTRKIWGGVSRYAATPLIVALSPVHSDITSSLPWSPIATGIHLDRAGKINNKCCSDDRQGWSFWSAFRHFGIHFVERFRMSKFFMNDGHNPFTLAGRLHSYRYRRNPAVFKDWLMNLVNNLRVGHCFESSTTRGDTRGKIYMFNLDHQVFDGGIRWRMFT